MKPFTIAFTAIGTHWTIDIYDPLTLESQNAILLKIQNRIDLFDKTYSRFRPDSVVTLMSQKSGDYILPPDAEELLIFYKKLYELTNHSLTPLIGQSLSDAGYDAGYSLKSRTIVKTPSWEDVLAYKPPTLTIKKPTLLDFGAAGKGYLVDIIGKLLIKNQISSFCIDAGGDILYKTPHKKPLKIGLEHPTDPTEVVGSVEIHNQSICGSAINRRKWGNFNHILNPHKLVSPTNILSIWVIASTAIEADGLATALFFTKSKILSKEFKFEYVIIFENFTYEHSSNFPGELYTDIKALK